MSAEWWIEFAVTFTWTVVVFLYGKRCANESWELTSEGDRPHRYRGKFYYVIPEPTYVEMESHALRWRVHARHCPLYGKEPSR